jgi:stage III sporulation protein AE
LLLALIVVILLPTPTFAVGEADGLWQDYLDILPGGNSDSSPDDVLSEVGFDALIEEILSAVGQGISPATSFFALVMCLATIVLMTDSVGIGDSRDGKGTSGVVSVIAAATLLINMRGVLSAVRDGLCELSVFLTGLLPVLSGILAAGGSYESAAMQAVNMNVALGIISFVESELIMPLVLSLFCLSAVAGLDGGVISKIARSVKGFFVFLSGIVTTVLAAALSMQSLITRSKDSAYLAAAKYAASGMIPMVGGAVSSALATLGGGLSVVRGAVGVGSVTVILGMTLSPLIMLLLYKLSLSIALVFLDSGGGMSGGVRAFSALKSALDALIAVYSMTVVIAVLEVAVFLGCGVNAFV